MVLRRALKRVRARLAEKLEAPSVKGGGITVPERSTAPVEARAFRPDEGPTEIDVEELRAWLGRASPPRLVDVRRLDERRDGWMPGSEAFPEDQVLARVEEFDEHDAIVLLCEDGSRADGIVNYLRGEGRTAAVSLDGGLRQWREAGGSWRQPEEDAGFRPGDPVRILRDDAQVAGRLLPAERRAGLIQAVAWDEHGGWKLDVAVDDHLGRRNVVSGLALADVAPA